MIQLTHLNDSPFVLNCEIIRTIEERPDTTITLLSGERMIVKEPMKVVVERVIDYGRLLRRSTPPMSGEDLRSA